MMGPRRREQEQPEQEPFSYFLLFVFVPCVACFFPVESETSKGRIQYAAHQHRTSRFTFLVKARQEPKPGRIQLCVEEIYFEGLTLVCEFRTAELSALSEASLPAPSRSDA